MNKVISSGQSHFGFTIIFYAGVLLLLLSILLTSLIGATDLFVIEKTNLFSLLAIIIIPSGVLVMATKYYYRFYIYSDRIEINYLLKSKKKSIRIEQISYVKFNDLMYIYNPNGGVLNIYSPNNKLFVQLPFYDRGSFGNKEIFHATQYLYNQGIEVEFGKTEREYKYYIQFFKENAG